MPVPPPALTWPMLVSALRMPRISSSVGSATKRPRALGTALPGVDRSPGTFDAPAAALEDPKKEAEASATGPLKKSGSAPERDSDPAAPLSDVDSSEASR